MLGYRDAPSGGNRATAGRPGARAGDHAASRVWIATVHAVDGLRFATASRTRLAVITSLAEYVEGRAPHVLWPDAVADVRRRLGCGDAEGAVQHYFASVGARWDEEWMTMLDLDVVPVPP